MKTALIIGGGASGAAAALHLAALAPDVRITILEKNDRILKKVLTTGNGKCNITNTAVAPACYDSTFAAPVIEAYGYEAVRDFFESLCLPVKADATGRCYPLSESAANVVNTLRCALANERVHIKTGFEVRRIVLQGGKFLVSGTETLCADTVILAIGSAASVKGYNGLDLLAGLNMPIARPRPALCPIPSDEPFLKSLKGVRVKGTITVAGRRESGEIQFTESAVSGICAFNLSKYVTDGCEIELNLCPQGFSEQDLLILMRKKATMIEENTMLLDGLFVKKLALVLLKRAGIQPSSSPLALSEAQIHALIEQITRFRLRAMRPTDYKHAQTVCGGLGEKEIVPSTLACKSVNGLFVCGEVLDADAPCGGFNLHWAWSSGLRAAESANMYLAGETVD